MSRFYLFCFITFAFQVTGGIKLDSVNTDTHFQLTCTDIGWQWSVYWYRNRVFMLKSYLLWSTYFTEAGKDIEERTEVSTFPNHRIIVKYRQDRRAYWNCCKNPKELCSNSRDVPGKLGSSTEDGTVTPPIMPTGDPINDTINFDATLTLTSHSEIIVEGQQMTLICTISNKIDEDKWSVLWIRNNTPVFITGNSSLSSAENLTNEFPHDRDNHKDILHSLFSNINVTSDAIQQKVVIPVSSSLIGWSLWNCANPYVANLSNTLILEVMATATPTIEGYTPSDHSSIDTKTTASSTGLGHRGNKTSSTTYIVAGSVGGILVLVLIVVMVLIVLKMKRRKETIMEDNVLYEGSKDNTRQNSDYPDDDLVIEDNVLYVSGNDAVSQEKGQKIPSGHE